MSTTVSESGKLLSKLNNLYNSLDNIANTAARAGVTYSGKTVSKFDDVETIAFNAKNAGSTTAMGTFESSKYATPTLANQIAIDTANAVVESIETQLKEALK